MECGDPVRAKLAQNHVCGLSKPQMMSRSKSMIAPGIGHEIYAANRQITHVCVVSQAKLCLRVNFRTDYIYPTWFRRGPRILSHFPSTYKITFRPYFCAYTPWTRCGAPRSSKIWNRFGVFWNVLEPVPTGSKFEFTGAPWTCTASSRVEVKHDNT